MILLIEGYKYKADDVKEVLEGLGLLENLNQEVIVNYVGYMYNPHIKDCVFILPKVLIDENEKAFGHIDPTDLIHLDKAESLTEEERRFICNTLIYWLTSRWCVVSMLCWSLYKIIMRNWLLRLTTSVCHPIKEYGMCGRGDCMSCCKRY